MVNAIEKVFRQLSKPYLTSVDLNVLFGGTRDRRYGQVKRALAKGDLMRIKRGLYCLGKRFEREVHPFSLAHFIYNPSYISLESALSYHQLIPEAIYSITSMTVQRTKTFKTPLGEFVYYRGKSRGFFIEVERVKGEGESFFMASDWKALSDYVFCYKREWRDVTPLVESLRIELEDLSELTEERVAALVDYYCSRRVTRFLEGVRRDLR